MDSYGCLRAAEDALTDLDDCQAFADALEEISRRLTELEKREERHRVMKLALYKLKPPRGADFTPAPNHPELADRMASRLDRG